MGVAISMPERFPRVACVVLNWNGWQDTLACLEGLSRVCYPAFTTIVIDNGSTDDSPSKISASYPHVELIESGGNIGFAAGNNVGIRRAIEDGFEYIWLLNNDTIPEKESLTELVRKAESDQRLGAVGSILHYESDPDHIQAWGGGKVSSVFGYATHAVAAKPDAWFDYLTAASLLVRTEAFQEVGLLDESFFLYWEDTEFGFRLRRYNWRLGVASGARVLHKESGSTSGAGGARARYFTTSGILFLSKVAKSPWISIPIFLLLRIGKSIVSGQWKKLGYILQGIEHSIVRRENCSRIRL